MKITIYKTNQQHPFLGAVLLSVSPFPFFGVVDKFFKSYFFIKVRAKVLNTSFIL